MVGGGEGMERGLGSHFDVEILPSSPWVHALPQAYRIYLLIHKPQNSSFHHQQLGLEIIGGIMSPGALMCCPHGLIPLQTGLLSLGH